MKVSTLNDLQSHLYLGDPEDHARVTMNIGVSRLGKPERKAMDMREKAKSLGIDANISLTPGTLTSTIHASFFGRKNALIEMTEGLPE